MSAAHKGGPSTQVVVVGSAPACSAHHTPWTQPRAADCHSTAFQPSSIAEATRSSRSKAWHMVRASCSCSTAALAAAWGSHRRSCAASASCSRAMERQLVDVQARASSDATSGSALAIASASSFGSSTPAQLVTSCAQKGFTAWGQPLERASRVVCGTNARTIASCEIWRVWPQPLRRRLEK